MYLAKEIYGKNFSHQEVFKSYAKVCKEMDTGLHVKRLLFFFKLRNNTAVCYSLTLTKTGTYL
jgi:hypothetical protein